MLHRHLNHQDYTLAAIDDVISRGRWADWAQLRQSVLSDRALLDKVENVCRPHISHPVAQRHQFWMGYAGLLRMPAYVAPTAGAVPATHDEPRFSQDADPAPTDPGFAEILAKLESVAGWKTARVQNSGNLDGIETCVRRLARSEPLETTEVDYGGTRIRVPTAGESLRIEAVSILMNNATRDYLGFAVWADQIGDGTTSQALQPFDRLYPLESGESALQQLLAQLAGARPYDLAEADPSQQPDLDPRWHDWQAVKTACARLAAVIFDQVCGMNPADRIGQIPAPSQAAPTTSPARPSEDASGFDAPVMPTPISASASFGSSGVLSSLAEVCSRNAAIVLIAFLVEIGLLIGIGHAGAQLLHSSSVPGAVRGAAPQHCASLALTFKPNATERDITGLLVQYDATVAYGPDENGAYLIDIPPGNDFAIDMKVLQKASIVASASIEAVCR